MVVQELSKAETRSPHRGLLWLGGVVGAVAGTALSLTAAPLPGSEPTSAEDVVDVAGLVLLGALGVVLLRRRIAPGLGRWLLGVTVVQGLGLLLNGIADALASDGQPGLTARLLHLFGELLYIPAIAVLITAPLLLFPTGQLPSRRWRPVAAAAVVGVILIVASTAVASGPLDDDVPAWGTNPLGVSGLTELLEVSVVVGLILVAVSVLGGLAAVSVRTVRSRGAHRRQMLWFLPGAGVLLIGLLADTGSSPVLEALSALVIFSVLLSTMAYALLGQPGQAVARAEA